MEEGPPFTKKETEICKSVCESMQGGMGSPLETSPSYINMSTARSSMMIPPTSAATSISFCSSMQQPKISSCSPYNPNNFETNPNPNPNPNPRNTGENQAIKSAAPPVYRNACDCSLTAQKNPASPHPIPNPNPNPKPNPNPNPNPSANLSTADPPLAEDRYTNSPLISAKSPLNHMLIKNPRQLDEQLLFDHDHQLGLIFSDDQLFAGLRPLPPHASSPLFSEGLQESWPPMITDHPYISIQAALMSPAPEITELGDLQEAEMSLFTSVTTARRWSLYDESSCSRKRPPDRSELPSTAASAIDSGTRNHRPLESLAFPQDSGKDMHCNPPVGDAQDGFPLHSAAISSYLSQKEVSSHYGNLSAPIIDAQSDFHGDGQSPAHHSAPFSGTYFGGKSTASERHRGKAAAGFSGHESEGLKRTSPATEMSSSSASELQDDEDSNTSNQYKPVETEATDDKLYGDDAPDLGKAAANVDNKPSKKPRKKGQRRVREARVALLTKSEVEHLEDGYRWRKYGQKAVKNSPHPRSYYRCTNSKCFVKKRVERCNEDPSLVITTYEGQHTHHSPALLRGCHDMLDPLISGPLGNLDYNNNAPFIPWHNSSLNMHPTTHNSPSHFPTTSINSTLNPLFRPLHSSPSLLLSKPLCFPTTPLPIPSNLDHANNSLARIAMHPHLQGSHHFMPRAQHVMQASAAHAEPRRLLSPTQDNAPSRAFLSPLVDKGLLDDMLPQYACPHNASPSSSS